MLTLFSLNQVKFKQDEYTVQKNIEYTALSGVSHITNSYY